MSGKKVVALDFDGVLNDYLGWGDGSIPPPKLGVRDFLANLTAPHRDSEVVIFSCRGPEEIRRWLREHDLDQYVTRVTSIKPMAHCYVDDRGIQFNGSFAQALDEIDQFEPYWSKGKYQLNV